MAEQRTPSTPDPTGATGVGGNPPGPPARAPVPTTTRPSGRFRSRLIAAFIVVAASSGGVLAATSAVLIERYRVATFAAQAEDEAALSLYAAPRDLSISGFEAVLAEYLARGGFDTVATDGDLAFSSRPDLGRDDVPEELLGGLRPGTLRSEEATVDGARYLVVGGTRAGSTSELFFWFPQRELRQSLAEDRQALVVGWVVAVVTATALGGLVARRTLRPVRVAAESARSLAEELLQVDVDVTAADELDVWARSFDELAAAVASKIDALERAAVRERRFTSDVAHELRTPLTGMASAAELLELSLDDLPANRRRPAELLIDDVRRLRALVLELLELARLDAGREVADLEPLDVASALAAVVRPWDGTTSVEVDVEAGLCVLADRARFRHVLRNLLANAVRHGGGSPTVTARRHGPEVAIDVLDRGPGVPLAERERIFERFAKGDASRAGGGSGLGLAIARHQAQVQGGRLEVGGRPGGGARFSLVLRAVDGAQATGDGADADVPPVAGHDPERAVTGW